MRRLQCNIIDVHILGLLGILGIFGILGILGIFGIFGIFGILGILGILNTLQGHSEAGIIIIMLKCEKPAKGCLYKSKASVSSTFVHD